MSMNFPGAGGGVTSVSGTAPISVATGTTTPVVSIATSSLGLVLLEQHAGSNSASLAFTTAITSAYDEYLIEFVNFLPASNSVTLQIQVSSDGGGTYDTGSNYSSGSYYFYNGGAAGPGSNSDSSTAVQILDSIGNTNLGVNGVLRLVNPLGTSLLKPFVGEITLWHASLNKIFSAVVAGSWKSTAAMNAFKVFFSTGNIASGTVRVYGFAKS